MRSKTLAASASIKRNRAGVDRDPRHFPMDRLASRSGAYWGSVAGGGHTDAPGIRIPEMRMKRCGVTSTETMNKEAAPVADGSRDR